MSTTYEQLLQTVLPRPIASDREYRRALRQIEALMRGPNKTRAQADMIALLATLIEQYEIRQGFTDPKISPQDRLAGLLEARQLTQTELAQRTGVPRTTLSEILSGKRGISKSTARRLAKFFGVRLDEFLLAEHTG